MHHTPDPEEARILSGSWLDWYTGYVQILPDDGINAEDYLAYTWISKHLVV